MAVDFGTDLSTFVRGAGAPDLDPTFTVISGRRVVQEAVARRFITPRGGLLDDPNYGLDLRALLNTKYSQRDLFILREKISAECRKDERVDGARVTVAPKANGDLTITISLTTSAGPFELALSVSQVTVELLRVT